MQEEKTKKGIVIRLLLYLIFAYAITALFLGILSFLLFKLRFSESIVNIAIIVIYVATTFFTGLLAGKVQKVKKFVWGFLLGSLYFVILFVISAVVKKNDIVFGINLITSYLLCAAGGMLGGMLS